MIRQPRAMKRTIVAVLSLVVLEQWSLRDAVATIDYVSGDVSGTWCADTVMVTGETRVPPGQRLQICAGVEVLFWTHCKLVVDRAATLVAVGTVNDSIRFDEYWPGNGWGGIRFMSAADSTRMEYCHLTHGSAAGSDNDARGGAIYCEYSSPAIRRCTIDRCSAAGGGGGIFAQFSDLTVEDCVIAHCTAGAYGGGINCQKGTPQLLRNVIRDNSAASGGGGILSYDCSPTIADNTIQRNTATTEGGGLRCSMGRVRIRHNDISDNAVNGQDWVWGGGVYLEAVEALSELTDNRILRNSTTGTGWAVGGGLMCYSVKETIISGNTFEANQTYSLAYDYWWYYRSAVGAGISCEASTVVITDNWIIGNVAKASSSLLFGKGGGINFTNCDSTSTISRNHINSNRVERSDGSPLGYGAGIYCVNSNPEISDNFLIGNIAGHSGGGINCDTSNPHILRNEFRRNVANDNGGAINCVDSSPIIESCAIDSCVAGKNGGAISTNAHPTIRNNTITRCLANGNAADGNGNGGGIALCCSVEPILEIKGNKIHDNHAAGRGGGIGMHTVVPVVFAHNEISDNSAGISGGGIFCDTTTVTLNQCTIVNNQAPAGGGLYFGNSNPVRLVNCILWGNETSQIGQWGNTNVQVDHSDVQGFWPDPDVIHQDPLFVDPVAGDYHLTENSPCIDAGDPDPSTLDPDDTRADMGCYYVPIDLSPFELIAPVYGDTMYTDLPTTFVWTAAVPSNPTGHVAGYELLWWTEGGSALNPETTLFWPDTTRVEVLPGAFRSHTTYYWWAQAKSAGGRARWAQPRPGSMFFEDGVPVLLSGEVTPQEDGILIAWRVTAAHDLNGFLVHRRAVKERNWRCISPILPWIGGEYTYLDDDVEPGVDYEYVIDAIGQNGAVNRFGPFTAGLAPPANLTLRLRSNPGRNVLNLAFTLPQPGDVTLRVFDVQGREMARTAATGLKIGKHDMSWQPGAAAGRLLPCGVYLVRLEAPSGQRTVRWVVVR